MDVERGEIGVGLVGYKFMGRAHSNAYRQVGRFFDLELSPRMRAICGRDEAGVKGAAALLGWESYETDYRRLLERDDVDLVDVATPGNTHHEIAIASLEAGKHVLCEKPLANTLEEAREMLETSRSAGTVNMVCFNYRRAPAVQLAKQIIEEGRLGEIRHWRAVYLQDFILDPEMPMIWRFQREMAGSGALGDIGAHIIDLAHFLVGPIAEVVGATETFIRERPLGAPDGGTGEVTVDDAAAFLARFENGAMGTFEATRLAPGRRNHNSFEINGSNGSLSFDLERMNELQVYFEEDLPETKGFRTVMVTDPDHPYAGAWWPPGHIIGYEHTFTHTVYDLMEAMARDKVPQPNFVDGVRNQRVLGAIEKAASTRRWITI